VLLAAPAEDFAMKTEQPAKDAPRSVDGKLISVTGDKLTCNCAKGEKHEYAIAKGTRVTCDGQESKISELKNGSTVRLTMCQDDKNKVMAIDCGKNIPELVTA
jgi:hypothetical protein